MVGFKVAAAAPSAPPPLPILGNNKSGRAGNGAAGGGSPSTLSTSAASAATIAAALHAPELVPVKSFVSTALAMKLRGNGTNYVHIVNTIRYVKGKGQGGLREAGRCG